MTASNAGSERVVVTGIGLQTALGAGRESSWSALCTGRHGARWLDLDDPGPPHAGYPLPLDDHRPRTVLLNAATEAFHDAALAEHPCDPLRTAAVIGMSKGDLHRLAAARLGLSRAEPAVRVGDLWKTSWPDAGAVMVGERLDLRGPRLAPIAACATGLIAALRAAALIRRGDCDIALAGAGDASLEPLVLGAFRRMGVLARVPEGSDPAASVRPWDRARSGFLVGEGAAVLVLEREGHARKRGALPYCEFAGGAFGADAYHLTDLNPDPANLAALIGRALAVAGADPSVIDHVNVHGTATRSNDPLEWRALRLALGDRAGDAACSANKAQVGHCLGAAGAVELAFTCLAVRDGFVPPTLNLDDPDPLCDLDGTPHVGRSRPLRAALKLSLGFGGHLAAAVVRAVDGARTVVPFGAP